MFIDPRAVVALVPIGGLAVFVATHIATSRARCRLRVALAWGFGVGLVSICGAAVLLAQFASWSTMAMADRIVVWSASYFALSYCYVIGFFNCGESARRVRLLIELDSAGPHGLPLADILRAYDARTIIDARLSRLLAGRQLVKRDEAYYIDRRLMLSLAKVLRALKVLFLGAPSELERRPAAADTPRRRLPG